MTWEASAEFRLNAIICIFIRGRGTTMKPAILKSVSPSSRKSTERKSFDRLQGYIRGIFSRREMGRGARLFRILSAFPVFCLD